MLYSIIFLSVSVSAATATIQPSSQDTFISSMWPGINYGGAGELIVYATSSTWNYRVLVQFDLSSIPPGSTVTSATLKLYYYRWATNNPAGRTFWAYRVTQSWTEMGVTWSRYDGTNSWATSGGDYTMDGGASATVPSSYGWMTWTVTDIVKAYVEDSEPNCDFLIKEEAEGAVSASYMAYFYSRESEETELRPSLEINYELAPTIESCDSLGNKDDEFHIGDDVYVVGGAYPPSTPYPLYIVEDVSWTDGMTIPSNVAYKNIFADSLGNVGPEAVWINPLPVGEYDIIVDVNANGVYDASVDALDDFDVEEAGFFVIPEFWFGTILGTAACFSALAVFLLYKRKHQ